MVRQTIPAPLRDLAKQHFGVRAEFIRSLGTKDTAGARALAPAVCAEFSARLVMLRAALEQGPRRLTDEEVSALCGRWLAMKQTAENVGDPVGWGEEASALAEPLRDAERAGGLPDAAQVAPDVARVLQGAGLLVDDDSRARLGAALLRARWQWTRDMERWGETGKKRWSETPAEFAGKLPQPAAPVAPFPDAVPFGVLLRGFAAHKGWAENDRNRYDRERTLKRFADFLGHDDATRVAKDDARAFRDDMGSRGLSVKTQRNDLSELSAMWRWGLGEVLPDGTNPFAGVLPAKPKRRATKRSFTQEDAAAILTAARQEAGFLRWAPWLCCLTGARLGEVVQSFGRDVFKVGEHWAIRLHQDASDDEDGVRSLKNEVSERTIPLHPALLAEGFLAYVQGLPAGSPLFPDVRPDKFNRRSGTASKRMGYWVRKGLKIESKTISPSHSWRHWFIDACRMTDMRGEVRSTLTGHSAKLDESADYGDVAMMDLLAAALARVQPPIPPLEQPGAPAQ